MIEQPWSHHIDEILNTLEVAKDAGLNRAEVADRKKRYGRNLLREIQKRSAWRILLEQFKNLIIVLLGAAAILSFFFGDWLEGSAIVAVIFINAAIGFVTELKAVRSMEALRRLGSVKTRVRRDGQVAEVPADNLVPGVAESFYFDPVHLAEPDLILRLCLQVLFLCGSAFFSGSETALFSLSDVDLEQLRGKTTSSN
jgi:hypothetical protein